LAPFRQLFWVETTQPLHNSQAKHSDCNPGCLFTVWVSGIEEFVICNPGVPPGL